MMNVAEVARRAGLPADTVRYYDRSGLLGQTQRTVSGYRTYTKDVVDRLGFIRRAKQCGLRLREISELLDIRDRGLCPCGRTLSVLEKRIDEADEEIRRLDELKGELRSMIKSVTNKTEWCYRADERSGDKRSRRDGKEGS